MYSSLSCYITHRLIASIPDQLVFGIIDDSTYDNDLLGVFAAVGTDAHRDYLIKHRYYEANTMHYAAYFGNEQQCTKLLDYAREYEYVSNAAASRLASINTHTICLFWQGYDYSEDLTTINKILGSKYV